MSGAIGIRFLWLIIINISLVRSLSSLSPSSSLSSSALPAQSSYLFNSASQFDANHTEPYRPISHIQPITNNWTPVISNRNNVNPQLLYTAINPTPTGPVITKVVPLVAQVNAADPDKITSSINVTSQYLTSESISRGSYQRPQNTYMIHPAKYQQAFSPKMNKTSTVSKSLTSKNSNKRTANNMNNIGNKLINSEVMPIPMIKPHRHGATLGFNLPDQGLTLYLDINELATKPMAQNIGLKVVSHNKKSISSTDEEDEEKNSDEIDNVIDLNQNLTSSETNPKQSTINMDHPTKGVQHKSNGLLNSPKKILIKKAKFRYKMAENKTVHAMTKSKPKTESSSSTSHHLLSPIEANKAKLISARQEFNENNFSSFNSNKLNSINRTDVPSASRMPAFTSQTHEYEVDFDKNNIQQKEKNFPISKSDKVEREIISFDNDEVDDKEDEDDADVPINFETDDDENDNDDNDDDLMRITTETPPETTTILSEKDKNESINNNDQLLVEKVKKQEMIDNELVSQMQTLLEKSAKLIDLSTSTCAKSHLERNPCRTKQLSIVNNSSTTVREIAQQLEANLILNEVPSLFESELQDFMDFSMFGYTIILPSNDAVQRLPPNLMKRWKQNIESFTLNAYLIEGTHTIESLLRQKSITTRNKMKLFINNPHNDTFTINGNRVIFANQKAPNNGLVHVIDGLLFPSSDKDIIDTLKSCGRFDGFVTLAEGTGFAETLKKGILFFNYEYFN